MGQKPLLDAHKMAAAGEYFKLKGSSLKSYPRSVLQARLARLGLPGTCSLCNTVL
jgi:hypothetical protein